jgi:hypothetical protein
MGPSNFASLIERQATDHWGLCPARNLAKGRFSARLATATVWRNLAPLREHSRVRQPRHILVVTMEEWVKLSTLEVSSRKASGWRSQKRQSKQDGWMTG